ncbi:unnamed protein product [Echinostoma caproni]|uniref:Ig-like domain-containing protein n=1 Tax=Echinostoma caproni TaxID=27848 RepID=A0A183B8X9_9TREM|nr:unnamed protein product [Echinostoma caproni]
MYVPVLILPLNSLDVDVILVPRIINKELLSVGRRVEDAVKLTCTALANGPPEMQFEFSQSSGGDWRPIEPRYKLSVQRLPPDPRNPFLQRLVLEISDLRRTDHGLYRCSVWNQAGRVQAIGHVLVHSEPEIEVVPHQTNYYVSHKPWRASCHVTGYPLFATGGTTEPITMQPNQIGLNEPTERGGDMVADETQGNRGKNTKW